MKGNSIFRKSIQSWDRVLKLFLAFTVVLSILACLGYTSILLNIALLLGVFLVFLVIVKADNTNQLSTSEYIITETLDGINIGDLPGVNKSDLILALSKYEEYKQSSIAFKSRGLFDIVQVRYSDTRKRDIEVDIIPNTQTEVITGYITIGQEPDRDYIEIAQVKYYIARLDGTSYPIDTKLNNKLCSLELIKPKVIPDLKIDSRIVSKLPYMQKLQEWDVLDNDESPVQHWGVLSKLELVGESK